MSSTKETIVNKLKFLVGKNRIKDDPTGMAEHWALGIIYYDKDGNKSEVWYEIAGNSKQDSYSKNKIISHTNRNKYSKIETLGKRDFFGSFEELKKIMEDFNNKWLSAHPFYEFNGSNCQLYVKEFSKQNNLKSFDTQNTTIGYMSIGAGLGAMVVGAFAIAAGLFIKGKHH